MTNETEISAKHRCWFCTAWFSVVGGGHIGGLCEKLLEGAPAWGPPQVGGEISLCKGCSECIAYVNQSLWNSI